MSKRHALAALLGLAALAGAALAWQGNKGWTPGKAKRAARAAVPHGSGEADADAWLRANGFTEFQSGSTEGLKCFETRDGISLRGATRYGSGDAPDPNLGILSEGTITVYFFFDEADRLVKVYVRPWIFSM